MVLKITDGNFEEQVKNAKQPVLVDFYADWCGPCRMMGPVVERMADRFAGKLTVGKLNVDENPETAMAYRVRSIPYIALFVNGEIVNYMLGAGAEEDLVQMISQAV